jgi:acyl-CoA thioester hydrolase
MFYEISTTRNDKKILIANAKTGIVCFDYDARKVINIPEIFGQIINGK